MQSEFKKKIAKSISEFYPKDKKNSFVLTYHSINEKKHDLTSEIYQLKTKTFYDQINLLDRKNFYFKTPENLFDGRNGCLVSFDDGYKSIIENALNFLNEKNIPYILFVCPSKLNLNSQDYMNLIELKQLASRENVYIGSHSYNHIKLKDFDEKKIISELKNSKDFLEQNLSLKINSISYPFGAIDDRVIKLAEETGYELGFTTKFDFIKKKYHRLNLPRVDVWDGDNSNIFESKVDGKWNWMRFFSKY